MVVLPTPPLSAPTTITTGFAITAPWLSLTRPRPQVARSASPHILLWARTWQKQGRIQTFKPLIRSWVGISQVPAEDWPAGPGQRCGPHGPCPGAAETPAGAAASLHGPLLGSEGGWLEAAVACSSSGSSLASSGGASGPGSWPPAKATSLSIRDCTEGWVANRSAKPSRGLSTQSSITAEVAPGSSPRPSILRSAVIMASGFLVSSTEPASARYSRDRDSASLTTWESSHASTISAIATMTTMTAPPPELLLSLLDEEELDEEDDDDDDDQPLLPDEFHSKLVNTRKNSSPKKPTTPAMMTATTISCTSPLRIWVSSWPSTASIS